MSLPYQLQPCWYISTTHSNCPTCSTDRSLPCYPDRVGVLVCLQDQLAPAVAGAFPDAAHFVLSAQQLIASSITPVCSLSLRGVLVYGAALHAFDALANLIEAGVDAGA